MMHLKDIFKEGADIPEPERKTLEEEMQDYSAREKTRAVHEAEPRKMYCPVCYRDFPANEEFCPQCGAELEKSMTEEERDEFMEAMFDMKV